MPRALLRPTAVSLLLGTSALLLSPAESLAAGVVRFIHAVPSAGKVTVEITQAGAEHSAGAIGFGQVTGWRSVSSGTFEWALVTGGKTIAHGSASVGNGAYDMVFLAKPGSGVSLGVYKAQGGQPGTSRVRFIHAAPELGSPQLRFDAKTAVSSLAFTRATPYLSVTPGVHTYSASPVGSSTPLISAKVKLAADTAYSEIVVGSDGQKVRVVPVVDRGAPLTRATAPQLQATTATISSAGTVEVKPGDSLWQIARDHLGPGASNEAIYRAYVAIWNLNAQRIGTGNPNLIFPGQQITLPTS